MQVVCVKMVPRPASIPVTNARWVTWWRIDENRSAPYNYLVASWWWQSVDAALSGWPLIPAKSSPTIGVHKHLHVYWGLLAHCLSRLYFSLPHWLSVPRPALGSPTDAITRQLRTSVVADVMGMSCLALGLFGRISCNCHVLLTSLRDRLEFSAQCHFSFLDFSAFLLDF